MSSTSVYSTIYKKIKVYKCENQPNTKEKEKPNFNKLLNKYKKKQSDSKSENLDNQWVRTSNNYETLKSGVKEGLENRTKEDSTFFTGRYI